MQDKWQASSKLTVDLGLRWELYSPFTPRFPGGFSNYNPENNTLELAGIGSIPMNLGMETRYKNYAPRLGLSYRLSEKTVIRSGFGITYTPFPDNTLCVQLSCEAKQAVQQSELLRRGRAR